MSVRIQSEEEAARAAEAIEERAEHISNVTYTHPNDDGSVSQEPELATAGAAAPAAGRSAVRSAGRAGSGVGAELALGAIAAGMAGTRVVSDTPKVGRNDPCPCGSGKKYKLCHGKLA
jgi:preprotein translocase subunit SecA